MDGHRIALVTGATGFVGSQLIRRLLLDKFEVRALTSGTTKDRLADVHEFVKFFALTESGIIQACKGVTHFFNFAVVYDRANYRDAEIYEVNVALPIRIIAALAISGRPVSCVLGDSFYRKYPHNATAQRRYTASKDLLAQQIAALPTNHPCRVAMLIIEQVYGPGENLGKVYPRVTRQLLQHEPRVSLTLGDQRRDFIHVTDVVEAAIVAGCSDWEGVVDVGCGSGVSTPVRTVFESLKSLSMSRSELGFGDIPSDQSIADSSADTGWLRSKGWTCSVPLNAGLQDFLSDVQRRCGIIGGLQ